MTEMGFSNPGEIGKRELGNDYNVEIDNWFSYHSPVDDQPRKYERIREAGKVLAYAIIRECPKSADSRAAIRKVREAVMTANASIACGGK